MGMVTTPNVTIFVDYQFVRKGKSFCLFVIGNSEVGVKDWRIDTVFHQEIRTPILHPYRTIMDKSNPMVNNPLPLHDH
jgi:hypothetical protein